MNNTSANSCSNYSNDETLREEVRALVIRVTESNPAVEDCDRLSVLLRDSDLARDWYLEECQVLGHLLWNSRDAARTVLRDAIIVSKQASPRTPIQRTTGQRGLRLAAAVAAALIYYVGGFALIAWNMRPNVDVANVASTPTRNVIAATVTADTDCVWQTELNGSSSHRGARLASDESLVLRSGTVEIKFADGATVLLEGPATFVPESPNRGYLHHGRLIARVPPQAIGFTIQTDAASVVDLGTEFGVEVSESGATDVHVIRGAVEIDQSASASTTSNLSVKKRLVAGQAIRVVRGGMGDVLATSQTNSTAKGVTTEIAALDLVDILAGGDGRFHRRNRGIDAATGRILYVPERDESLFGFRDSNGYCRVDGLPFIDGVGIPNSSGAVQLTSAKHMFQGFPKNDGKCYAPIWAGGTVPAQEPKFCSTFDGKLDYGQAPHGFIALVPNKLITFDLDAIRREYPGRTLATFRSVVGMTKSFELGLGDTWVFVDGEVRHNRLAINHTHGGELVEIPLASSARFLTLAATDGGNTVYYDWIMFGDPTIEFEVNESQPQRQSVPAIK